MRRSSISAGLCCCRGEAQAQDIRCCTRARWLHDDALRHGNLQREGQQAQKLLLKLADASGPLPTGRDRHTHSAHLAILAEGAAAYSELGFGQRGCCWCCPHCCYCLWRLLVCLTCLQQIRKKKESSKTLAMSNESSLLSMHAANVSSTGYVPLRGLPPHQTVQWLDRSSAASLSAALRDCRLG